MKYLMPTVFLLPMGAAHATTPQEHCEAAAASNSMDAAMCACIVDALGDDAALIEEYLNINTVEEYEASSEALQGTLAVCAPEGNG